MEKQDANEKKYNITVFSCFVGYIVQAIVVNFAPLLFLTFRQTYGIPLSQITLLITVNFAVQLSVDLASAVFVDKIGYRACILTALFCSAAGIAGLAVLPEVLPSAFAGLMISVVVYAVGGGLIEVLVSPIMESCPTKHKEKAMSLLHSFYSWGQVGVVLFSTLFFALAGIRNWRWMALIWTTVPVLGFVLFARAPIAHPVADGEKGMTLKALFCNKIFWVLLIMMICAGASEQAVSQWASAFAEQGLGISKTMGDLLGPMLFAVMMGISRLIYGKFGDKIPLGKFMAGSGLLCVASYLAICLIPHPMVNLIACGVCGFSVGILWPGTFSQAAGTLKRGGTALFALLALGGDLGCTLGPTLVGGVTSVSGRMNIGILSAIVFPILITLSVFLLFFVKKKAAQKAEEPAAPPPASDE